MSELRISLKELHSSLNIPDATPSSCTKVQPRQLNANEVDEEARRMEIGKETKIKRDDDFEQTMQMFTAAISELKIHGMRDFCNNSAIMNEGDIIGTGSTAVIRDGMVDGKKVAIKVFSYNMDEESGDESQEEGSGIVHKLVNFVDEARLGFKASSVGKGMRGGVAATLGMSGRIMKESREIQLFLIMEMANGCNLADLINDEQYWATDQTPSETKYAAELDDGSICTYAMPTALKIELSIALTIAALQVHGSGVCHCDIKPENAIVDFSKADPAGRATLKVSAAPPCPALL